MKKTTDRLAVAVLILAGLFAAAGISLALIAPLCVGIAEGHWMPATVLYGALAFAALFIWALEHLGIGPAARPKNAE